MGPIAVPTSGLVYLDANSIIYSVEKHPVYSPLLLPVWQAAQAATIEIVSSELVLMEALVGAYRNGDAALALAYEQLFQQPRTRLLPITLPIIREAAKLRAMTKLKSPDALHAATALDIRCALFVTNDADFQKVAGLPYLLLDDLLKP